MLVKIKGELIFRGLWRDHLTNSPLYKGENVAEKLYVNTIFVTESHGKVIKYSSKCNLGLRNRKKINKKDFEVYFRIYLKNCYLKSGF